MTMLSNMPRYSATAQIRSNVGSSLLRLGRLVNRLVAVALARYERHAQLAALRYLSDRELKDIGIYRGEIDHGLDAAAKTRARLQRLDR
jgi:uncharacterized protein YjiS (DUF1127 family)